jgi:translocation protein SEC63
LSKGKGGVSTLGDFLKQTPDEIKAKLTSMNPQQLADIQAFQSHVSDVELKAEVEVEDEDEMVVGDVATVKVQLKRRNLQEKEAMGPVHAPFFPEPKFEEWWLILVESASTKIIGFEKLRDTSAVCNAKLNFQIPRPGQHAYTLHAMCDSYAGLDQKVDLKFVAKTENEVKRDIYVHPEDEALDLQPTLFQQFMGELGKEEDSEEEEEEETKRKPVAKKKATPVKKDLGESNAKADSDSDSDSSDSD